jgi:hypothetical protein
VFSLSLPAIPLSASEYFGCASPDCFRIARFYSYAGDFRQVGLVGTLLSGAAQVWFAPLVETASPLLENFPAFLAEIEATFGETD